MIANSLQDFRAVACLDFEIIELKHQFCGNTHTHTHTQTDRQITVTLRPRGRGLMIWLPGMPYTLYCNYGFTPLLYSHSTVARRLQVPV